jgi:hypothetical protein
MEKPGMVRGSGFYRTGLLKTLSGITGPADHGIAARALIFGLPALLFFLPLPVLGGQDLQDGAGEIAVTLESSPERPILGGSWRISILVDHPVPEEVTVIPPELPSSLTFAQSRKETRFVRTSAEQGTRWTLAEFLFVPHRTGEIVLEPFEALVGDSRALTPAARTTVIAREGEREEYHPRLVWDAPRAPLRIGEAAELSLRVLDRDPLKPLRRLPLSVTVPVEALLEEIPLTEEELDQGLALRLRLIPLEGTRVSLGPFPLRFETLTLEAPVISMALAPPRQAVPPPAPTGTDPGAVTAEPGAFDGPALSPPAFPEVRGEPFPLFRNAYRETLDKARDYWRRGLYAEALGELRRGERDLLSGPALASTRRAAELLLGLSLTEDEKWRPRNCFVALIVLSFCLLLPTAALSLRARGSGSGRKSVTSLFFHGYSVVAFVLIGAMVLGIAALARSSGGFEGLVQGNGDLPGKRPGNAAAVLRSCAAYRVPDVRGAISARWLEGQPVRVRSASDAWAYAESSGGDAGWVSQDNVVFY